MLVQVPFNNLPEETRESLALTLLERSADRAAITDTGRGLYWMGWLLVAVGLVGMAWRVLYGFGTVRESAAIHGPAVTAEFLVLGALIGVPLPWLLVRHIRRRACPFPPGRYLLPADYIDARDPILHIVPIQEARSIQIARSASIARLSLEFDGPSGGRVKEVFTVRGKDRIERAIDGFLTSQAAHEEAVNQGDEAALIAMDPLYHVRVGGWSNLHLGEFEPQSSLRVRPIPWWTRGMILWFPIAIGLGSLLLASVRDQLSDAMVFELLLDEDSTAGWAWYIDQDGARSDEVVEDLLPRAENAEHDRAFAACQEEASVRCWNAWLSLYGSTARYQDSVRMVERELKPRAALDEALAAGSVAALRQYQESVESGTAAAYGAEARREIADSIADARRALLSQLASEDDLATSLEGMMDWLEVQGDTVVSLRFESPQESDAEKIDGWIEDSYGLLTPVYDDRGAQVAEVPIALLSPEFQADHVHHRERRLHEMLMGGFGAVLPPDIMELRLEEPLGSDEVLEQVRRPTILVRTRMEPVFNSNGMIQVLLPPEAYGDSPDFEGVYGLPAIRLMVDLSIHLPGEEEPFEKRLKIRPPADMRPLYSEMAPEAEHSQGSGFVNRAFWMMGTGLRAAFFRDGTEAHAGMRLGEDDALLRAMVVAMLADGLIQQEPEAGEHANEYLQLQVMMHKMTGLVLPEPMIRREIAWVDEHMGEGGWIDRVARGRELILQPLQSLPSHARPPIPLAVAWMGQVYQLNSDRIQGGLNDPEQLLLSNLLDSLEMSRQDYAREWGLQFRN